GVNVVAIEAAFWYAAESDLRSVRRPTRVAPNRARARAHARTIEDLRLAAAVRIHHKDPLEISDERDLRAVGRKSWASLAGWRFRDVPLIAAVRIHHIDFAGRAVAVRDEGNLAVELCALRGSTIERG